MGALYSFEAKSIQTYITAGGRLRDMAGGSMLVDMIAAPEDDPTVGDLVADVLEQLGPNGPPVEFVRRAGGALTLYCEDADFLKHFRALFTLALGTEAPGLAYRDCLQDLPAGTTIGEALASRVDALTASDAAVPHQFPQIGPLNRLAPRTGQAAVPLAGGVDATGDLFLDAATRAKRQRIGWLRGRPRREGPIGLEARMLPADLRETHVWPTDLGSDLAGGHSGSRVFPGMGEGVSVGLFHADGNGLGQTMISIQGALKSVTADASDVARFLRAVSESVADATQAAVQRAVAAIADRAERAADGKWVLPARPVLLGGDDLTVYLRGDVAIDFAKIFLAASVRRVPRRLQSSASAPNSLNALPSFRPACRTGFRQAAA